MSAAPPVVVDSPSEPAIGPIAGGERLALLDTLRGFALLGIGLMNVEFFTRPLQDIMRAGVDPELHGIDLVADAFVYFFVQGKFWTLFSLLFGMGFALMIERARAAGRGFVGPYLRRSLALLLIGTVHALWVWSGDILVTYALGALVLLALRAARRRWWQRVAGVEAPPLGAARLARWATWLYAFPLIFVLLVGVMGAAGMDDVDDKASAERRAELAQVEIEREAAIAAYSRGSYAEANQVRMADTLAQLGDLTVFGMFVISVFVFGVALLRTGWVTDPASHLPTLRRARNLGLLVGFALMGVSMSLGTAPPVEKIDLPAALQMSTYLLAGLVLALGYGAWMACALQGRGGAVLERWLAPVGRMALTHYLLQSVCFSLVFYGYGLGLWGQVSRTGQLLLVVALFVLQMVASRLWLARFRFGPVEWLWRAATYGRIPALRRG